ncbi:hypothetical protein FB451DRAFT_286148 [Mycena latifolia]|nr:hypothetical protein FB451DRAFT_286148 [Mycena latifolia]
MLSTLLLLLLPAALAAEFSVQCVRDASGACFTGAIANRAASSSSSAFHSFTSFSAPPTVTPAVSHASPNISRGSNHSSLAFELGIGLGVYTATNGMCTGQGTGTVLLIALGVGYVYFRNKHQVRQAAAAALAPGTGKQPEGQSAMREGGDARPPSVDAPVASNSRLPPVASTSRVSG